MSQKRKHVDNAEDASSAPKPFKKHRSFKPGQTHPQPKHSRRPNLSHDDENGRSTNALKSRIRDLKRFLVHMDSVEKHKMSAGARQERERELEACEHELAERVNASREAEYRKKMIGKYHQVRFFDRQKGTRILKRLKKELSALDDDSGKIKLEQRIHNAQVDVNYAIYYPLMKPYSSLYPKSKNRKTDDSEEAEETGQDSKSSTEVDGPKGDVEMWRAVERAMEEGTLDKLRYSKDMVPAEPPKKSKKPKTKENKKGKPESKTSTAQGKANGSRTYAVEEEEESDGGFFE
ncbi:hypothetical protein BDU57DRAFT_441395 [Ampelomyces quisqualis]|uniref:rRNA-processing protein EFG1 n=1 Tax=Ampelomyces quisqualis TaxID=50730 RepID=A0A6A5QWA1_AMPQU|nr:hypothetical protein BDU57DRAFT_441395 [Ampelomyces quisqualis]